ncbi:hypothetical protein RDABS01_015887 [Bienertia sinuspersici]
MFRDLRKEHENIDEVHCSRERSRAAWEIIDKYLMPFVERERYEISRSCRLHPDNDLFRDHERHKIKADINEWQCGYCKKSFLSEVFLDRHFDSRHNNLLNFTGSKCLADLCGALHCDHILNSKLPRAKCNPAAAARNRLLCESLADGCFPVSRGPSASRLHGIVVSYEDEFVSSFCNNSVMPTLVQEEKNRSQEEEGQIRTPVKSRKETSVLYIAGSILTLMLLPLFYVLVCLHQSETRKNTQELKRISRLGRKAKPM